MNTHPIVLIVIPAYNESEYIERCLRSVMSQDYESIRVFIQDNQSTDDTYSKIRLLASNHQNIAFSRLNTHGTSSENWKSATDKALERFESQFVIYLAADDYYSNSSCIRNLVEKSILEPKAILVPLFMYTPNSSKIPDSIVVLKSIKSKFILFRILKFLTSWDYVHGMYGLFPRKWFEESFKNNQSKFTSSAASDWWWIYHALMQFKLKVATEAIYVRNTRTREVQPVNNLKKPRSSPKKGILNNRELHLYIVSFPSRLMRRGFSVYRLLFHDNEREINSKSFYLLVAKSAFTAKALKNIIIELYLAFFSKASWVKIVRNTQL